MDNSKKIILDLCGGTGSWSKPYKDAGYTVYNITLPRYDIKQWQLINETFIFFSNDYIDDIVVSLDEIFGIFAAPPCTMFSFARTNAKKPRDLEDAMMLVINCLSIIWECQKRITNQSQKKPPLRFWALENPNGMLNWFLGKPAFEFNPYDFGEKYKKHTCLWGHFNDPIKNPTKLSPEQEQKAYTNSQPLPKFDQMKSKEIHSKHFGKYDRATRRSITPQGFAQAFFQVNQ